MARTEDYLGIPEEAENFLKENAVFVEDTFRDRWDNQIKRKVPKKYHNGRVIETMFEDDIELSDFLLKDGTYAYEDVQAEIWSSGPVIFTALYSKDGNMIVGWDNEEIQKRV